MLPAGPRPRRELANRLDHLVQHQPTHHLESKTLQGLLDTRLAIGQSFADGEGFQRDQTVDSHQGGPSILRNDYFASCYSFKSLFRTDRSLTLPFHISIGKAAARGREN